MYSDEVSFPLMRIEPMSLESKACPNTKTLERIEAELHELNTKFNSAFVQDDIGEPDIHGHRQYHKRKIKDESDFESARSKILRDILVWVSIGTLVILSNGVIQGVIIPFIKKVV